MKIELYSSSGSDNSNRHFANFVYGKNPMYWLSLGEIEENEICEILTDRQYRAYHASAKKPLTVFEIAPENKAKAREIFPRLGLIP